MSLSITRWIRLELKRLLPRTPTAILAVHVYGQPCRLNELADIARRYNLKLIYDAAHAFGVTVNGKSLARHGDVSMFSFHATKLFHTCEGGMLIFRDAEAHQASEKLKNFGFDGETQVVMPGTNAKLNELQSLLGLHVLPYVPEIIARRASVAAVYRDQLSAVPGLRLPHTAGKGRRVQPCILSNRDRSQGIWPFA